MISVGEEKMINTIDLLKVNNMNLNRGMSTEGAERIDPTGCHLLKPIMVHNDNEMRCWAQIKANGTMEPMEIFFDVPLNIWSLLENAHAYARSENDDRSADEKG